MSLGFYRHFKNILNNIKKMQSLFIVLIGIFLMVCFAMCTSPRIYIENDIRAVTEKDFNTFYEKNDNIPIEMKTRDNCRSFSVDIQIKSPFIYVKSIKITRESLTRYLEDKVSADNVEDKFVVLGRTYATDIDYHVYESIDVFLNGISDDKVYDFFDDYTIEISWVDFMNRKHKKSYYLKNYY